MVKLANTLDLGSSGAILAGSSPVTRTIIKTVGSYELTVFIILLYRLLINYVNLV